MNIPPPATPYFQMPKKHSEGFYILVITIIVVSALGLLYVLPWLLEPAGVSGAFVSMLWALIPLAFTSVLVWFIDRWEPEPAWLYVVAFAWGAGVAVMLGAFLNDYAAINILPGMLGSEATVYDLDRYAASWVAPVSEEFVKGMGVILIFFAFKRYFNGPVDGIVYGALIGAGFAFTENILYFVRNFEYLDLVFQIRFLDGPLSHDIYTAFFGFFIGFAEYSRSRWSVLIWMIPAMLGAMSFHYFNNDALNWEGMTYELYVFISNVPLAALAILMVWYATRYERKAVIKGLTPFVAGGWFSQYEVAMVSKLRNRAQARKWAEQSAQAMGARPGQGSEAMERFQTLMIELGHDQTRAERRGLLQDPHHHAHMISQARSAQQLRMLFAPRQ
ncbi:MAG: PrsW family intramembrane metalloprotease [Actinomycetaceae bacterium]|nr:PrsW family intramembrane metalloprotease [Actinomycetaceae bacterium]